MSHSFVRVMLSLQGVAFGFLTMSAALGGSPTRVLGFGSAALLMAASALLLQGGARRMEPPKTVHPFVHVDVVIREKPVVEETIEIEWDRAA